MAKNFAKTKLNGPALKISLALLSKNLYDLSYGKAI